MRMTRYVLCFALVCLTLISSAWAVPAEVASSGGGLRAGTIARMARTAVKVAPEVTQEEAAQRLSYLGLLSGSGWRDGKIDFDLSRDITKLEAMVMTARMLGVETEILEDGATHPFSDVPEWGGPYVGYFWERGLFGTAEVKYFAPSESVSTEDFLKYMFFALGFDADGSDYSLALTGQSGIQAKICTELKDTITRGDAVMMMFRTLNAQMAESKQLLSQHLLEREELSYQDVQFLLWETDAKKANAYIEQSGYTTEKILPDGKYTIVLSGTDRCLNVAVDGGKSDYEGVGVTVWKRTGDVSQKFRTVRTEQGTYKLYSCASNAGFNRVLGIGYYGTAGLYCTNSTYAGEYYIRYSDTGDGSWYLISAADSTKVLGSANHRNGASVTLSAFGEEKQSQLWAFEFDGVVNAEGYEYALYPSETLCVTQGAYGNYSHQKQNALDITTTNRSVYAPFTGKIVRIDRGYSRYNTVWLQSCDKVVYADGSVDYMTVVFMHDNNVSDLSVGQIVGQGEYFYDMGVAGGATGSHVHIACIRGKYSTKMALTGSGDVYVQDAFFLPKDVTVYASNGLNWVTMN